MGVFIQSTTYEFIPFLGYKTTLKQQLNGEKRYEDTYLLLVELLHYVVLVSSVWKTITKQHNKTAQPKVDKYPTSHFLPFNCCFVA